MGLADILAPLKTAIPARLQVTGLWPDPTAVQFLGPTDVSESGGPPEISWQPVSAKLAAPRGLKGGGTPGALFTRELRVEFLLWGQTLEQTEQLYYALVNELQAQFTSGGFELTDEAWPAVGESAHGVELVLAVVLKGQLMRDQASRPVESIGTITFTLNGQV